MRITLLDVENKIFIYPTKLNNILDFNFKKLSIQKVEDDDNLKGYFKINDDNKYLRINFTSESQKMMYETIWKEIKKLINNEISNYSKDYTVFKFDSNDVLP